MPFNPASLANLKRVPKGQRAEGAGRKKGQPNRVARDLAELCRTYTAKATRKIVQIMEAEDTPPGVALSAAIHILDRGYGKPRQEHQHRFDPRHLTDEELEYLISVEQRLSGLERAPGGASPPPLIEGSVAPDGDGGPEPGGEPGEV